MENKGSTGVHTPPATSARCLQSLCFTFGALCLLFNYVWVPGVAGSSRRFFGKVWFSFGRNGGGGGTGVFLGQNWGGLGKNWGVYGKNWGFLGGKSFGWGVFR